MTKTPFPGAGEAMSATTVTCRVPTASINAIRDNIDKKGGMLAKAQAAKHLSQVMLNSYEDNFGHDKGEPGSIRCMKIFTVNQTNLETFRWILSEVWELSQDLAAMVDDLSDAYIELADAAFLAEQGSEVAA